MHCFLRIPPTGPSLPCVISDPSCPAKGCVCRQVRSRCRTWWLCWLVMRTKYCCLVSSSRWSAEGVPCCKASRCCHRSRLCPQVFVTAHGSIVYAQHQHTLLRCACVSVMSTFPACAAVAFGSVVCFSLPWNSKLLSSCVGCAYRRSCRDGKAWLDLLVTTWLLCYKQAAMYDVEQDCKA